MQRGLALPGSCVTAGQRALCQAGLQDAVCISPHALHPPGIGIQVVTEATLAAVMSREAHFSKHLYRELRLIAWDFCVC